MQRQWRSVVVLMAVGVASSAPPAWANSAPVVSNVTASQRTDGSKKVDIRYNLADADGDACTVSVKVSSDGGSTWTVPVTARTGAVGSGVTPGSGKLIVWDAKVDLPGAFGTQYKVQICADDGHTPVPPGMVLIPAGEFLMGNSFDPGEGYSDELPRHAVYVDAFYMDRTEVTNQQYADALNWAYGQGNLITVTSGLVYEYNSDTTYPYPYCSTTSSPTGWPVYGEYSQITWNSSTFGVVSGKGNYPMMEVSWYGSVAYANWRSAMQGKPLGYDLSTWTCNWNSGYRLPTEAEWEKAARGGVAGHRFPWSDSDTIQHARANYYSHWVNGYPRYSYDTNPTEGYHPAFNTGVYPYTSPVGYFAANGYGLYDMAGNVGEWNSDWYGGAYYTGSPYNNPHGPTSGGARVLGGGFWCFNAYDCRVAGRYSYDPWDFYINVGLRLVGGCALDSR